MNKETTKTIKVTPKEVLSNIIIEGQAFIFDLEGHNRLIDGLRVLDCNHNRKDAKIFLTNTSGELFWIEEGSGSIYSARWNEEAEEIGFLIETFNSKKHYKQFHTVFSKVFRQM